MISLAATVAAARRRLFPVLRALAVFAACLALCRSLPAQAPATGVIEGRVSNTAAGQFLKQVRIVVENSAFETLTNEAGEFRLTGVPSGAVTLRATAAGLDAQTMRLTVAAGQTTRHDFNLAGEIFQSKHCHAISCFGSAYLIG